MRLFGGRTQAARIEGARQALWTLYRKHPDGLWHVETLGGIVDPTVMTDEQMERSIAQCANERIDIKTPPIVGGFWRRRIWRPRLRDKQGRYARGTTPE